MTMGTLRWLHQWAGASLALIVALIAFAGAASMFRMEMLAADMPALHGSAPDSAAPAEALARFECEHGMFRFVNVGFGELNLHRVFLAQERQAYIDGEGALIGEWGRYGRIEEFIFALHHNLLVGRIGALFVSLVGLIVAAFVVTGVILWWPARRSFKLSLAPKSPAPPHLIAFHRNWGVVLAVPLFIQALTGAYFELGAPLREAVALKAPNLSAVQTAPRSPEDWARVFAAADSAIPGGRVRSINAPKPSGGLYVVNISAPGELNPNGLNQVFVNGATGEVVASLRGTDQNAITRVVDSFYTIHSGAFGGLPARIALAVMGVFLGFLSLIGGWSFVTRRGFVKLGARGG